MVVPAGREFLAIPGPTTMPDEVLRAMHRPALDIYSDQMVEMTERLLRDLSRLFATKGRSYIYIATGHGACEPAAWGVDVAMSGSQKGLMAPPGLGFVAANERARQVHKTAGLRTPYWDWTEREGSEHYRKYAGTAPVHLLFALRQSIDMLFEEKLENAFLRHRLLAESVRRAVAVWAEGQVLGFHITEHSHRSPTLPP